MYEPARYGASWSYSLLRQPFVSQSERCQCQIANLRIELFDEQIAVRTCECVGLETPLGAEQPNKFGEVKSLWYRRGG